MTLPKNNYHDYFIKDGRHIGDYEGMYENCPDPWNIETLGPRLDMLAALLLLDGLPPVKRVVDIGAGAGLFSGLVIDKVRTFSPLASFTLTDIAASAVGRLKTRFLGLNGLEYQTLDLRGPAGPWPQFDLAVMAQVLWGLLEDLPGALANLNKLLGNSGYVLISQHFPGQDKQGYGADVINSPDGLAAAMATAGFEIISTLETNRRTNHHWAALCRKML